MSVIDEIVRFLLSKRGRLLLIPFVLVLLLLAVLFVIVDGASWAPFVYAIF